MNKIIAKQIAERARRIAEAMRAQHDYLTSLKYALREWEREADRWEAVASCEQ